MRRRTSYAHRSRGRSARTREREEGEGDRCGAGLVKNVRGSQALTRKEWKPSAGSAHWKRVANDGKMLVWPSGLFEQMTSPIPYGRMARAQLMCGGRLDKCREWRSPNSPAPSARGSGWFHLLPEAVQRLQKSSLSSSQAASWRLVSATRRRSGVATPFTWCATRHSCAARDRRSQTGSRVGRRQVSRHLRRAQTHYLLWLRLASSAQEFKECISTDASSSRCADLSEDYLECLHHKKEVCLCASVSSAAAHAHHAPRPRRNVRAPPSWAPRAAERACPPTEAREAADAFRRGVDPTRAPRCFFLLRRRASTS